MIAFDTRVLLLWNHLLFSIFGRSSGVYSLLRFLCISANNCWVTTTYSADIICLHYMRGQPGHSPWPHGWLLPGFQGMNAGMTSQPNVALICKLRWSLMCFAYIVGRLSEGIGTFRHCQTSGRLVQDLNVCTVPNFVYVHHVTMIVFPLLRFHQRKLFANSVYVSCD